MAPLSRELCGVILEYDGYGTHLDERGRTIDEEKEKLNFEHAGQTLANIWNDVVIDKYPVVAFYVPPENSERDTTQVNIEWKLKHVRESHYFLQVSLQILTISQNCFKIKFY